MLLLCIIFLFNQKTAYEMRISDWSSDVALPILSPASILSSALFNSSLAKAIMARMATEDLDHSLSFPERIDSPNSLRPASAQHPAKIGRASCRERVCPYV